MTDRDDCKRLADCPIGLFMSQSGELCLKTEYGSNEGRIDAYIVSSGEFFWGGVGAGPDAIAKQRNVMVRPIDQGVVESALRAASVKAGEVVAVRPLQWVSCDDDTFHDVDCQYEIDNALDSSLLVTRGVTGGGAYVCNADTLDAAKAAAQADYEQRIRSALTPEPMKAGDEVMREAFKNINNDDWEYLEHLLVRATRHSQDAQTGIWRTVMKNVRAALSTTAPQPDNGARGAMREALTDARNALVALRTRLKTEPSVQGRGWISLGNVVHNAIDKADRALAAANQSDGGGGSRPALKEERIETTNVHEDRTTSLAAVRQMAGVAPGPSDTAPAEPVAWRTRLTVDGYEPSDWSYHNSNPLRRPRYERQPLYAHPPRSVDVEAIKRALIAAKCDTGDGTYIHCSMDQAARSIAAMIEGE